MSRIIVIIYMTFFVSACSASKAVVAMNRSTDHFITLERDSRILYEAGSQKSAEDVANKLDSAVSAIEERQYRRFSKPISIYVCNTVKSFASYCVSENTAGCVLNERLFLSPKNFQPNKDVLIHELSHLHIEYQIGMYKWLSDYPAWFKEGLATFVSEGQGARTVTTEDAKKEFYLGNHFSLDLTGSLLFPKTAHSFGLEPHVFYRQSAMFVQYIHDLDPQNFKIFLLSVEDGKSFEQGFSAAYGETLNEVWGQFVKQQKS